MKLNEFLKTHNLQLKVSVCSDGSYRVGFTPCVEIYDRGFLTSECGVGSKDILIAINNTLKNISNQRLKITNTDVKDSRLRYKYIDVLEVEL